MHVKIKPKMLCVPHIWLCLFMFRPITLRLFNSLTKTETIICLGGLDVTHQSEVPQVLGSIPASDKGFYVYFLFLRGFLLLWTEHH